MQKLQVTTQTERINYDVIVGRGLLSDAGKIVRRRLGTRMQRVALIANKKVFNLYGSKLIDSLEASGLRVSSWLMADGERHKTFATAQKAIEFLSQQGLERSDGVISLGGGVTSDLAGFAAATYLRGIPLIQVPTTLLAQIDASIGGKVGVNFGRGKNRVGSFHHPRAVIIDVETLTTLPARERVAGWCECVKQGAVSSQKLFKQTVAYLAKNQSKQIWPSLEIEKLIAAHCAFKAAIVSSDPREDPQRVDARSRRILNFGHTVGHALEAVTGFRRFRHGEAVGWGMLAAGELAKNLGMLEKSELELLREGIRLCGPLPNAADLKVDEIVKAIATDKKRDRGQVQWILLERIGRPRVVSGKTIPAGAVRTSIRDALQQNKTS